MNFATIDFETADPRRDSACAIGIVQVKAGKVIRKEACLLKPPRGVQLVNAQIHGITWPMVKDAPTFGQTWPLLADYLDGADFVAAHNAPFDRSVLEACCEAAEIPAPTTRWLCTVKLAKVLWPELPSFKLPDLMQHVNLSFEHHNPLSDALAVVEIVLRAEKQRATLNAALGGE